MKEFWGGLRMSIKALIIVVPSFFGIYYLYTKGMIPGLSSQASKAVSSATISQDAINTSSSISADDNIAPPNLDEMDFADVVNRLEIRVMEWVWFANAPIFTANGGLNTMKGTLMDKMGLNVKIITNNSTDDMKREQLAFVHAYAQGEKQPKVGVAFNTIMGDGATEFLPAMNDQIAKTDGPEFQLKIFGTLGFSLGEDCIMGPKSWQDDPQSMKGCVISAVIGDGDWGIGVRFCGGDNGLKINPDPDTYDPDAINFIPAPEGNFMLAAQDVINDRIVKLKLKDSKGVLTGQTVEKHVEGAATWFPGDKQIVEKTNMVKVVSTAKYPNQMACVIVGCDKWMKENSKLVVNFLSAALTASNQIKENPEWFKYATDLAPKIFCSSPSDCSESSADWYKYAKAGGGMTVNIDNAPVSIGGTQQANLADNYKYFGLKGGNNYYQSVWEYFSGVVKDLNPAGFMDNVKTLTAYDDAVDLSYLKQVKIDAGKVTAVDYSKNTGHVFAQTSRHIEFETGSAIITPQGEQELEKVFQSANSAETARMKIVGHTDNVGSYDLNMKLSLERAKSVKAWLLNRSGGSFPAERFIVDGRGSQEPLPEAQKNATPAERAKNRRVVISLLE